MTTTFCLGSIVWREYTCPHHISALQLMKMRPDCNPLILSGDAAVDRARAIVATRFLLQEKEDVLVFVDSDIQFDPRAFVRIAEQAHEINGIVGGLYTVRRENGAFPACKFLDGQTITLYDLDEPDLVAIDCVSGGFMAIPRTLMQTLAETSELVESGAGYWMYDWFSPFVRKSDNLKMPEDWAFCERARAAGFPIMINPHVRLRHYGSVGFHAEDMVTTFPENGIVRVTRSGDDYAAEMVG